MKTTIKEKRNELSTLQLDVKKGISQKVPKTIVPWKPKRKEDDRWMKKAPISNGEQKVSVAVGYEK